MDKEKSLSTIFKKLTKPLNIYIIVSENKNTDISLEILTIVQR